MRRVEWREFSKLCAVPFSLCGFDVTGAGGMIPKSIRLLIVVRIERELARVFTSAFDSAYFQTKSLSACDPRIEIYRVFVIHSALQVKRGVALLRAIGDNCRVET